MVYSSRVSHRVSENYPMKIIKANSGLWQATIKEYHGEFATPLLIVLPYYIVNIPQIMKTRHMTICSSCTFRQEDSI